MAPRPAPDHRDRALHFDTDLALHLDHTDEVSESIKDTIDRSIAEKQVDAPDEPRHPPVWRPGGVGRDAEHLAERIGSRRGLTGTGPRGDVCHVLALGS